MVASYPLGFFGAQGPYSTICQQSEAVKQRQSDILKSVVKDSHKADEVVLKDPPVDFEFIADPPSISAFDLDVVKLTAQFVARNGRQFLTNLMHREQKNYQFDFLRPQHSLFQVSSSCNLALLILNIFQSKLQ